jgi:hypothetical protein
MAASLRLRTPQALVSRFNTGCVALDLDLAGFDQPLKRLMIQIVM